MKLLIKEFNEFSPAVVLLGAGFVVVGGYPLLMMSGSLIVWIPRAIFGLFFVMGLIILIRQFQLWKRAGGPGAN